MIDETLETAQTVNIPRAKHAKRSKSERRSQKKLHRIIYRLTDNARLIEESVLENGWLGMRKKADASSYLYHRELDEIVQKMHRISLDLFLKVETAGVRVYGSDEILPDTFREYFYASQHLTNAVTEDILSAPSLARACMRIERWVALLKLTHERHDYFSANIIMLALASAPVARSGLEALLTKTAKAVLAYCQKKYIDHAFMFNVQAHRLLMGEAFIPFLPVIAKGLSFIKESVSTSNKSKAEIEEITEEKQEPYYTQLATLKNKMLANKLTRKEELIVRELRKEPLLSFDKLFDARSANWVYRKRREWFKVNLTMASLKAFDKSDRFYLAKQEIEEHIKALQALGDVAELTHTRVMIIIRNTKDRESTKYHTLRRYYRTNAAQMTKTERHLFLKIISAYADIIHNQAKAKNIEPRFKKRELVERAESFSSELSSDAEDSSHHMRKHFSYIVQREKELGLKADSPVLQRRLTRESLGFFEGKASRRQREKSSRALERSLSF